MVGYISLAFDVGVDKTGGELEFAVDMNDFRLTQEFVNYSTFKTLQMSKRSEFLTEILKISFFSFIQKQLRVERPIDLSDI